MIVAELFGTIDFNGYRKGSVFINDEKLPASYHELLEVCGSISAGSIRYDWSDSEMKEGYINEVAEQMTAFEDNEGHDLSARESAEQFVEDNKLTHHVCFSEVKFDVEKNELKICIDTYDE